MDTSTLWMQCYYLDNFPEDFVEGTECKTTVFADDIKLCRILNIFQDCDILQNGFKNLVA